MPTSSAGISTKNHEPERHNMRNGNEMNRKSPLRMLAAPSFRC
jgi:hypothetical protein